MLLYTDPVQVDKMLQTLKNRIKELEIENYELKNRPIVSDTPIIQVVSAKSRFNLDTPVASWTVGHFLKFYQTLYKEKYGTLRTIKSEEWGRYSLRIHDFFQRHSDELTKPFYKEFIEWIFNKMATKAFIPQPGNMVSDAHYYQWRDSRKEQPIYENGFTTPAIENTVTSPTMPVGKDISIDIAALKDNFDTIV